MYEYMRDTAYKDRIEKRGESKLSSEDSSLF